MAPPDFHLCYILMHVNVMNIDELVECEGIVFSYTGGDLKKLVNNRSPSSQFMPVDAENFGHFLSPSEGAGTRTIGHQSAL